MAVAKGWTSVSDFIAVLECGLRRKLNVKKGSYIDNTTVVYGVYINELIINIEIYSEFKGHAFNVQLDWVKTQQLVSKLNKILYIADKFVEAKVV